MVSPIQAQPVVSPGYPFDGPLGSDSLVISKEGQNQGQSPTILNGAPNPTSSMGRVSLKAALSQIQPWLREPVLTEILDGVIEKLPTGEHQAILETAQGLSYFRVVRQTSTSQAQTWLPEDKFTRVFDGVIEKLPTGEYQATLETIPSPLSCRLAEPPDSDQVHYVENDVVEFLSKLISFTPDQLLSRLTDPGTVFPGKLVCAAELERFDKDQEKVLLPWLWNYILKYRHARDQSQIVVAGSAIRKCIYLMPIDRIEEITILLESDAEQAWIMGATCQSDWFSEIVNDGLDELHANWSLNNPEIALWLGELRDKVKAGIQAQRLNGEKCA